MAETVLFNIADGIIEKLGSSVWEEIKLWWSVKDELEELKTTVSTIKAVLFHAEEQSMESPQVKDWVGSLSDAMYDADDLLDDFSTQALRQQMMSGSKFSKEVRLFFSTSNQIAYGLKMAHQIKVMRDRLEKIKANKGFFLEERPAQAPFTTKLGRDQTHSSPPAVVVGREHDKRALIELLLSSDSNDENVSIISIVGIGGLGKTTLAQLVYKDDRVQKHFELEMWACVSDDFDVKSIVQKILESATNQKSNVSEMDALKNLLHEKLSGKRYLLVLDDVWNENFNKWLQLKDLLVGGARGSKIIITTRLKTVAEITHPIHVHVLEGLTENESWSLFKQRAFKPGQVPSPSHEAIGKEIVPKCKGVPLAIDTIGGLLFCKDLECEWLEFKNKELSKVEQNENDILPTLRLSYNHLPSHLKHCFAYCSLFLKDTDINVSELIQLWIAQGYVKSSDPNQGLEDLGRRYFTDLCRRSFFQEVWKDNLGSIEICKMHDLMHDLAMSVAGLECTTVSSSGMEFINEKTRHILVDWCSGWPGLPSLLKARKVRTLLLPKHKTPLIEEELDAAFCKLRSLRVLGLFHNRIKTVPSSIYKLKHLRYLDLTSNYSIEKLPDSITKLQNLQVVKLYSCHNLKKLPKDIKRLVNLRYLDNSFCNGLAHMPRGIRQLTQLEKLSLFVIAKKDYCVSEHSGGLDELHGLNKLRGSLTISNLRYVKNGASECRAANLKEKQQLQKLSLHWKNYYDNEDENGYSPTNEEMGLEELQPHQNLKVLKLVNYGGAKCPSWLPSLTNLVEIRLYGCKSVQCLLPLDHLSSLRSLDIEELTKLECIELSDGASASFFDSLGKLYLVWCPNLEGFVRLSSSKAELPCFLCLSNLRIGGCPNLKWTPLFPSLQELSLGEDGIKSLSNMLKAPVSKSTSSSSTFPALSQLKQLQINSKKEFVVEELLQNLTSLEILNLFSCESETMSSGDGMEWEGLKSLRSLLIGEMPNLESLPKGLQFVTTLQHLEIYNCPNLKCIPEWMPNLTSLQYLKFIECPPLSERCNNNMAVDWPYIATIPNIEIDLKTIQRNGCYLL